MKLGFAYTTHDRMEVARRSILKFVHLNYHLPEDSFKMCIVDDASKEWDPILIRNYTFSEQVGVGSAKNKCLEILYNSGCTDFFLLDDDTYPVVKDWYLHYTESGLNHACYTFNRSIVKKEPTYTEFVAPNGCMIYLKRCVLDTVGGWDLDFKGYGYDHVNFSDRIFNAGLTPARYIDIPNGCDLFEMAKCESSFTSADREMIPRNRELYKEKFMSKEYKEFRG